jgi:hypothetical protein
VVQANQGSLGAGRLVPPFGCFIDAAGWASLASRRSPADQEASFVRAGSACRAPAPRAGNASTNGMCGTSPWVRLVLLSVLWPPDPTTRQRPGPQRKPDVFQGLRQNLLSGDLPDSTRHWLRPRAGTIGRVGCCRVADPTPTDVSKGCRGCGLRQQFRPVSGCRAEELTGRSSSGRCQRSHRLPRAR